MATKASEGGANALKAEQIASAPMKGEKQKLLLLFKSKDPIRKREHLGGIIVDFGQNILS